MSLRSEVVRIFNELLAGGKKITQLPDADLPLTGSEYIEIVQNGINKKVQVSQLPGGGPVTSGFDYTFDFNIE